jgi:peptidoglycan/LPS O-acetylase OafA/YrhL
VSILVVLVTESGWTLRDVAANALFITGPAHVARMNGVYWTLYIEVLFYALVPLIIFIGRRAILSGPCLVTTLFGGLWVLHVRAGVAPHYLAYCLTGLQFGAWQRDVISGKALALSFGIVVIATGILPIVAPFPDIVSPLLGLAPLVCGLLLWLALVAPFRSKPVAFFGNISYSLYLVHAVIGFRIANTMLSYGFAGWIAALAGVAVSILLSVVTLAVVERPMIGLGKRIIRQWRDLAA